jgi:hypothetical protein
VAVDNENLLSVFGAIHSVLCLQQGNVSTTEVLTNTMSHKGG